MLAIAWDRFRLYISKQMNTFDWSGWWRQTWLSTQFQRLCWWNLWHEYLGPVPTLQKDQAGQDCDVHCGCSRNLPVQNDSMAWGCDHARQQLGRDDPVPSLEYWQTKQIIPATCSTWLNFYTYMWGCVWQPISNENDDDDDDDDDWAHNC